MDNWSSNNRFILLVTALEHCSSINLKSFAPTKTELWAKEAGEFYLYLPVYTCML